MKFPILHLKKSDWKMDFDFTNIVALLGGIAAFANGSKNLRRRFLGRLGKRRTPIELLNAPIADLNDSNHLTLTSPADSAYR